MIHRLARRQPCPIPGHGWSCQCPRVGENKKLSSRWEHVRPGVRRIKDESVDGGYRYRLSSALKKELLNRRIREQSGVCALFQVSGQDGKLISPDCPGQFTDYSNITLDHVEPRGIGGSRYDDGEFGENLKAVHHWPCNQAKGSRRI